METAPATTGGTFAGCGAYALAIGRGEGADLYIVELAALLHDIADWKFHGGDDRLGPQRRAPNGCTARTCRRK